MDDRLAATRIRWRGAIIIAAIFAFVYVGLGLTQIYTDYRVFEQEQAMKATEHAL